MSEIVYAKRTEHREHLPEYGRAPTDTKVTVFASPNKVALVQSWLVAGAVRNSDKHYWQWRTTASQGFFRNRAGNLQPYYARRSWDYLSKGGWVHAVPQIAFSMLQEDVTEESAVAFRRAVWENLHIKSFYDLYPMAEEYRLIRYNTIPFELRVPMRATSWEEFTTLTFSKSRTNKRLVAAVANTDPYVVALAHQFRGLVEDKRIVKFIEDTHFDEEMEVQFQPHNPNVRKLLKLMTEKELSLILKNGLDMNDLKMIQGIISAGRHKVNLYKPGKKKYQSWADLYNWRV